MPRPKLRGETRAVNLNIELALYQEIDKYARTVGISKTFIIEKALKEYLEKNKKALNSLR